MTQVHFSLLDDRLIFMWTPETKAEITDGNFSDKVTLVINWHPDRFIDRLTKIDDMGERKNNLIELFEKEKEPVFKWLTSINAEVNNLIGSPTMIVTTTRAQWNELAGKETPLDAEEVAVSSNSTFFLL